MRKIKLIFPTPEMEKDALEFKMKFYNNGEKAISGSYKLDTDRYSYPEWLEILRNNARADTADPRFGVSDTFFAVDMENEIVGIINIRYDMTDFYKNSGHIGYSVAPDKRGQGCAAEMLRVVLEKARERGMTEVKLVCAADNIPSKKTILACGGKLNRLIGSGETVKEEYLIVL